MSAVPIGCANDTTPMYETNASVFTSQNPLSTSHPMLAYPYPLPVASTLIYTLRSAPVGNPPPPGFPQGIVTFIVDAIFQLSVTAPPGEDELGLYEIDIGGSAVGTTSPIFHLVSNQQITVEAGGAGTYYLHVCGFVNVVWSDELRVSITRAVGNPNVTVDLTNLYTKAKIIT